MVNTANVQPGDSVAIFGVGGVGLSAVVGAKMRGADPIIAVDLDESKLEFAKRFGATHGINASKVDAVEAIHAMTGNPNQTMMGGRPVTGVDFAFDCIGLKVTMEQIVPACRGGHFGVCQGGTAVLVGVPSTTVELNAGEILGQEKQFRGSIGGSCSPDRDFPMFLDWHTHGDLDLESMVTERYAIDDINEATTALEEGRISGAVDLGVLTSRGIGDGQNRRHPHPRVPCPWGRDVGEALEYAASGSVDPDNSRDRSEWGRQEQLVRRVRFPCGLPEARRRGSLRCARTRWFFPSSVTRSDPPD